MAAVVPAAPTLSPRLPFVDALRGLAVALMVVNHTARWWLEPSVGSPAREALIYVTMVLAGPTFLLLVGFSLALAYHGLAVVERRPFGTVLSRNVRRAAGILAAGALVNAVVFPDDVLGARVLISIGLAVVVVTPLLPLLRRRPGRCALLGLAPALYAAFLVALPGLGEWSRAHPIGARVLLREFPLLPWLGLVLVGLCLGWAEAGGPDGRRDRRYALLGAGGLAGLTAYAALDPGTPLTARLDMRRDLALNGYWTAGPVTAVGLVGAVLALLAGAYALVERRGWRAPGLVRLGRAALAAYVVHLVVVVPLGRHAWGISLTRWGPYVLATALLLAALTGLAPVWLALRRRRRRPRGGDGAGPGRWSGDTRAEDREGSPSRRAAGVATSAWPSGDGPARGPDGPTGASGHG